MNKCLNCNSTNTKIFPANPIMGLYLEAGNGEDKCIFKNIACHDCGSAWTEEYRLAEISQVQNLLTVS